MKVSIVIPTFKRPDFLERLLTSIEQQTFQDFEVIVVNDNSINLIEYDEVISKFKLIFNEFTYLINSENRGAPFSRNRGIKIAKYALIALVDDDDEWLPKKLRKQVDVFLTGPADLGLVYTWTLVCENNEFKKDVYKSNISGLSKEEILKNCFVPSPSVVVTKSAIINSGLFDENLPSCQDWDMWTRLFLNNYSCDVVKEYQTIYHKHEFDTIGISKKALIGYQMYYKKHFVSILFHLKFEGIIILLKHYYGLFLRLNNDS